MLTSRQETIHIRCHEGEKSSEEELEWIDQLYVSNFAKKLLENRFKVWTEEGLKWK